MWGRGVDLDDSLDDSPNLPATCISGVERSVQGLRIRVWGTRFRIKGYLAHDKLHGQTLIRVSRTVSCTIRNELRTSQIPARERVCSPSGRGPLTVTIRANLISVNTILFGRASDLDDGLEEKIVPGPPSRGPHRSL